MAWIHRLQLRPKHRLDAMGLRDLWLAFICHATVQVYAVLTGVSLALLSQMAIRPGAFIACVALGIAIYPLAWYLLHRYVLHGRYLYRFKATAALWKRIHFDHHRDPHDLDVLFGSLATTLPTIALVTMPVGYAVSGLAGAVAAFVTGLAVTLFYEFCHCIQHLKYQPQWAWVARIKKYHLQHHFHDEHHNFGITNYLCDRLFGTFQAKPSAATRSDTVFNLGYTREEVRRYPWVAALTHDLDLETAIRDGVARRDHRALAAIAAAGEAPRAPSADALAQ